MPQQQIQSQFVEVIDVSSRSRAVDPEKARQIADSIQTIGLLNPITVRYTDEGANCILVAGAHRLAAAQLLGWESIDTVEFEGDELSAELAEIDENLQRAELTPAQRAAAIHRRKEIWDALHPSEGDRISVTPGGRQKVAFAGDTQKVTGEDRRRTNEHLSRAEALGPDIHEVVGTSLDKGVELDALKNMEREKRRELIDRAKAGEKVSARPAKPDSPPAAPAQPATRAKAVEQPQDLQARITELEAELVAVRDNAAELAEMLESYDTVSDGETATAKEIARLKAKIRTVEATRNQWMTTCSELRKEVAALQRKIAKLEGAK